MTPLRVFIVDDHEGFRRAATTLLTTSGFEVVGSAPDGESTFEAVAETGPDLVLVDLQLPGIDGVEVAERLAQLERAPDVIIISSRDDAGDEPRVRAGATRGFIAKRDLDAEAIRGLLAERGA
jgi:DNA-binding NarL/FixJ family response regulator